MPSRTYFDHTASLKTADIIVQAIAFLVAVCLLLAEGSLLVLYITGSVQSLSSIVWSLYFRRDIPGYRAGMRIRCLFHVIAVLLLLSLVLRPRPDVLTWLLLAAGPVPGLAYFIVSIREAAYYGKARKPFYLL